ncbi:MAG TPA: hypothetical protein VGM19_03450 [Armatimonadota bacterium]|jgi:uncharacterized membrane protein HdeD (DUF308 family)
MRYVVLLNKNGQPPSRWQLLGQQILAGLILLAVLAAVIALATFFFSVIAAVIVVVLIAGVILALVLRLKYGKWWER